MCGRYERRGDKQKIAEAFHVKGGLDEVDFGEDFDCAPGSIQPVVWMNEEGERALGLMRWGFKLPTRLLFNVSSEGVAKANFWKDKFATNRCIVPASSFFEWKDSKKCTTWGLCDGNFYLIDVFRKKLIFPRLRCSVLELFCKYYPEKLLIEDKGSGASLIQELKSEIWCLQAYSPNQGSDKLMRLDAQSIKFERGRVYLPSQAPAGRICS